VVARHDMALVRRTHPTLAEKNGSQGFGTNTPKGIQAGESLSGIGGRQTVAKSEKLGDRVCG